MTKRSDVRRTSMHDMHRAHTTHTRLFRFRSLHVFARTTASNDEFCKVRVGDGAEVGDLKNAAIAKLRLDAAPNRVRMFREVEGGGAPVPLDSRRALAEQGILEGSSVLVEVLPLLPPPLPPALPYVLVRRDGSVGPTKITIAPGADADDLKKAVIAVLKLDMAPDRMRMLHEVEGGGAPVPLDSRRALAEQGVLEGSSLLVEILPSPAFPPPPALPLLTLDANPAATPYVDYRGALGSGETSTLFALRAHPLSRLLPCAPTLPPLIRPFTQH